MSDEEKSNKHFDKDPERTLITLEQLSQTIEVMTTVVNRLRQHLSEQLKAQIDEQYQDKAIEDQPLLKTHKEENNSSASNKEKNLVVEIRQQEVSLIRGILRQMRWAIHKRNP